MLLTARDRELVEWIGRFGAVEAEHLMAWFGTGRTAPNRWLREWVEAELLVHLRVAQAEPGLLPIAAPAADETRPRAVRPRSREGVNT